MFKEVWQGVDCAGQQNASKIDNHRFSLRPSDESSKASLDKSIKRCLCLFLVFICLLKPGQCRPSRGGRLQCNGPDCKELFGTYLSGFSCQDSPEYYREKDHGCLENLGERMEEVGIEDGIEGVHPSQWVNLD